MRRLWVRLVTVLMFLAILIASALSEGEVLSENFEEEVGELEEFVIGDDLTVDGLEYYYEEVPVEQAVIESAFDNEQEASIENNDGVLNAAGSDEDTFDEKDNAALFVETDSKETIESDCIPNEELYYSDDTAILSEVYLASDEFVINNAVLYKYNGSDQTVSIPGNVAAISDKAFADNVTIHKVTIPDSVNTIGREVFSGCINLETVEGMSKVTSIGADAFAGCKKLKTITMPNGLSQIQDGVFTNCENLRNIIIGNSVQSIGAKAFYGCGLKYIQIPASVKSIGDNAFGGCPAELKVITYCNSVAQNYCRVNKISYVSSGHTNNVIPGIDATCTKTGLTQGIKCSVCEEIINAQKTVEVNPNNHTSLVGISAVEATCSQTGLTVGVKCRDCGKITIAQQAVAMKPHTPVTINGYGATYTSEGLTDGIKCAVCGAWITPQTVIPMLEYAVRELDRVKSNGTVVMEVGEQLRLLPQFATNAGVQVTNYKSAKTKYATVDGNGIVTAVSDGKSKITVSTDNKKIKATITVQVRDAYKPKSVSIIQGKTLNLSVGESIQLDTALQPSTARATLAWKSNKPSVVGVDGNGVIATYSEGKAKITVTTHNRKKATIDIIVDGVPADRNVHYRALLIGQARFPGSPEKDHDRPGHIKDVSLMAKALSSVKGPEGNSWRVTTRIDRTKEQVYVDIQTAFAGATSNDVSLFFISTHGVTTGFSSNPREAGQLEMHRGNDLGLFTLAEWLNNVPGRVIVLINACGSGSAVYTSKGLLQFDCKSFAQNSMDAFNSFDMGVLAPGDVSQGAFVLPNKFYVMTAAADGKVAWGTNKGSYFAKWITSGIKTKGKMPADTNKDKFLTLNELCNYVFEKARKVKFKYNGVKESQEIQVYPVNSAFPLFYRK